MVSQICLCCQHIWHKWYPTDSYLKSETFKYKTQIWGRFMFLIVKEIVSLMTHTRLTVTTAGHQKWSRSDKNGFYLTLLFQIHNAHPSRIDYFCDIFSSYIYLKWGFQTWCVFLDINQCSSHFISRFLSSKYAPQHV